MSTYDQEFMGIPARFTEPTGADPNYSGGYRGLRMQGGHGRAAYGDYRLIHGEDLGTEGGFPGLYGRRGGVRAPRLDPRWEDTGFVGDPHDPIIVRDFDARSPMYANPEETLGLSGADVELRERMLPDRRWSVARGYRPGYTNRGVTEGGYSDAWARGKMRGAR